MKNKDLKSRRKFLKTAGLAAGGATLLAGCGQAEQSGSGEGIAKTKRTLTMVTTWPKNFPGLGTGAERFARNVEALSDGAITIKVYGAGELVPALSSFDAVSEGKADMYHAAEYYWQGHSKAFNFFCAVPFGMTGNEVNAWIHFDGGQELWDELSGGFNVKPFMCGNSGTQMGGWFRKEINSLEDLKGLRIRMPGLGGEMFSRVGATPVTKPGGEIFLAMSQGNIDAAEWVGPWNDLAFGFHEVAKNYYTGVHEPGTIMGLGLNLDLWNEFSDWEKTIFKTATEVENSLMRAEFEAKNAAALKTLVEEHGVMVRSFPDEVLIELKRVAHEVLEETGAEDDITGRVYKSFMESMARTSRWGEISERTYTRARDLGN